MQDVLLPFPHLFVTVKRVSASVNVVSPCVSRFKCRLACEPFHRERVRRGRAVYTLENRRNDTNKPVPYKQSDSDTRDRLTERRRRAVYACRARAYDVSISNAGAPGSV